MTSYTIGEVSARSGFPATTLRYYEDIGLVVPATRTAAGYRVYDDGTLDRLAFVARAKQAGCTLEEVADLVELWDGGRCVPVQRRLHELVTTKLGETERQITELEALAAQLRSTASRLAGPAIDGPCDAACACNGLPLAVRR
jgi:MerR family copper efflux transcriptional regulator